MLNQLEFELAYQVMWPLYLLFAGAFGATLASYWRVRHRLPGATWGALVALRCGLLGLLLIAFLNPVYRRSVEQVRRTGLVMLIDNSRSMSVPDAPAGQTRGQAAQNLIMQGGGLKSQLRDRYDINVLAGDSATQIGALVSTDTLALTGSKSDLVGAMNASLVRKIWPSALVLFSDGNSFPSSSLLALKLPVYTVGCGSLGEPYDLHLGLTGFKERLYMGQPLQLQVLIDQRGPLPGAGVGELVLRIDGFARLRTPVEITAGQSQITLPEQLLAEGEHSIELELSANGELITANNRLKRLVSVRRVRRQVLMLSARPGPEGAFLRRLLRGDNQVRLVAFVQNQGHFIPQLRPESLELEQYDTIILDGIVAGDMKPLFWDRLAAFVGEQGGGMLYITYPQRSNLGGSTLAKLLPTVGPGQVVSGVLRFMPVPGSALWSGKLASNDFWSGLPQLTSMVTYRLLKPGAEVELVDGRRRPFLARQRYGNGRVIQLCGAESYLWQLGATAGSVGAYPQFYQAVWGWLQAGTREVSVEIWPEALNVTVHRPVDVRYNTAADAAKSLQLHPPQGAAVELLPQGRAAAGAELFRFTPDQVGVYRLATNRTGANEVRVNVIPAARELSSTRQNVEQLKELSAQSGGQYYTWDEAAVMLPQVLQSRSKTVLTDSLVELWNTVPFYLVIILLLAGEWLVRKKNGLL